jgi:two-component system chemotaxis response regulator CheY
MRILVVDDDAGSRLVARATVEGLGHECVTAADGREGWDAIQRMAPHVVITDREMPELDGVELCRRIRAAERDSYTYIVVLTSHSDPADVLSGMQAGADDYVTKPLDPVAIEAALLAAARVTALHAELAAARAELARQAHTDPLTGLRNRLSLVDDLEQIRLVSERYDRSYCIAVFDVDHFKRYNDMYGHLAGDNALRAVGAALADRSREADRVYRVGGEEFLIVLPEQSVEGGTRAVERIRQGIESLKLTHAATDNGLLTISVGLAASVPGDRPTSSEQLIARADVALYEAKSRGRNCLVVA